MFISRSGEPGNEATLELYVTTSDRQTVDTHEKGESGGGRGGGGEGDA